MSKPKKHKDEETESQRLPTKRNHPSNETDQSNPLQTPTCNHANSKRVRGKSELIEAEYAVVARRKECLDCGKQFFTIEDVIYNEDQTDRGFRRVVSAYFTTLMRKGLIGSYVPAGWPWNYLPSMLMQHFKALHPEENIANKLRQNLLAIKHITPLSEFNYPLPNESDFYKGWAMKNLILMPSNPPEIYDR